MDMDNIHPELGIFPRIAMNLFKEIQNKKENTAMTICICESNFLDPIDLYSKMPIRLNPVNQELQG